MAETILPKNLSKAFLLKKSLRFFALLLIVFIMVSPQGINVYLRDDFQIEERHRTRFHYEYCLDRDLSFLKTWLDHNK